MMAARGLMRGTILLVLALLAAPAAAERPAASDHTTPGGIAFRHVTLAEQPRHAIAFGWHDGFALARPGREGVVLLGRRLLLEGTAELNRNAYSERLKDLGAATNLGGTIHTTQGLVTAAPDQLAAAVGLFAGVLANPAMAPDRLAFLQKTAAATARAGDENAEQLARGMMHRLTLGAGPLLDAVTQPAASFLAVTPDDVAAWRRTVLVRDRVLVASAGPMTPAAVAVEIDRLFAGLPAYSSDAAPAPAPVMRANARLIVLERAVAQTVVVAGGPSGWTTGPDQLRGAIAIQSLLGFEGRMFRALRERHGATYGVQANLITFHGEARAFSILSAVDST